jgi:hypothetical protein
MVLLMTSQQQWKLLRIVSKFLQNFELQLASLRIKVRQSNVISKVCNHCVENGLIAAILLTT